MENKINKIGGVLIIFFLFIGILVLIYRNYQLKNNFKIVIGKVTNVQASGWKNAPGDCSVLYEYFVEGKKYSNNNNYNFCDNLSLQKVKLLLENKSFPVAYAVDNPNSGVMIIKNEEASMFKYNTPDSLLIYDSVMTCK